MGHDKEVTRQGGVKYGAGNSYIIKGWERERRQPRMGLGFQLLDGTGRDGTGPSDISITQNQFL